MKLTLLSQWFDPEPGPARIPGILGREFVRMGHDVSVLTGFPNYPTGTIYPGFTQRRRYAELREGIEVTRVRLYPSHDARAMRRIANYTSFGLSALASGRTAFRGTDAVWVFNSPVTVSLPLLAHTGLGKLPYFLHVQDLWPDSLIHSGMFPGGWLGRRAESVINHIVRLTEHKAAVIGVISPSVRNLILERNPGLDPAKIVFVPNPADESLFRPVGVDRSDHDHARNGAEQFELMYIGSVGEVQGLATLLDAAERLQESGRIRITIVGSGISRDRLASDARRRQIGNVRFLDRVPMAQVPALIARSDAQMVSLAGSEFLKYTMPSKIASILAMGVPIIGQIAGDGARTIRDAGAGLTSEPGDADGLASAIDIMARMSPEDLRQFGDKGRLYYEQNLAAAKAAEVIIASLERQHSEPPVPTAMGIE